MKLISYAFFYGYIGTVLLAGFWGAFINPVYDFKLLFHANVQALPDSFRINLLSQYRFLRALELGFGIFTIIFRKEIFNTTKYNRLFLIIMCCGILSRIVSVLVDGSPNTLFYFFLFYEVVSFIFIFIYTRNNIIANGSAGSNA
jgi:hypothetical protein